VQPILVVEFCIRDRSLEAEGLQETLSSHRAEDQIESVVPRLLVTLRQHLREVLEQLQPTVLVSGSYILRPGLRPISRPTEPSIDEHLRFGLAIDDDVVVGVIVVPVSVVRTLPLAECDELATAPLDLLTSEVEDAVHLRILRLQPVRRNVATSERHEVRVGPSVDDRRVRSDQPSGLDPRTDDTPALLAVVGFQLAVKLVDVLRAIERPPVGRFQVGFLVDQTEDQGHSDVLGTGTFSESLNRF